MEYLDDEDFICGPMNVFGLDEKLPQIIISHPS